MLELHDGSHRKNGISKSSYHRQRVAAEKFPIFRKALLKIILKKPTE